jgi:hypothetical protein
MKNITRRVQRLEALVASARKKQLSQHTGWLQLVFGHLRRLPGGYQGERHIVIARRLPDRNGQHWVEFEEVPGPGLPPRARPVRCLNVIFVAPDPGRFSGTPPNLLD